MLGSSLRYLLPGGIAMYIRADQAKVWAIRWAGDRNLEAFCRAATAGSGVFFSELAGAER
jgi:hypothetical protein